VRQFGPCLPPDQEKWERTVGTETVTLARYAAEKLLSGIVTKSDENILVAKIVYGDLPVRAVRYGDGSLSPTKEVQAFVDSMFKDLVHSTFANLALDRRQAISNNWGASSDCWSLLRTFSLASPF
jgi:hypothetical protein